MSAIGNYCEDLQNEETEVTSWGIPLSPAI